MHVKWVYSAVSNCENVLENKSQFNFKNTDKIYNNLLNILDDHVVIGTAEGLFFINFFPRL